jgi:subtilisin family serine protease
MKHAGIADYDIEHVYGSAIKGFSVKMSLGQMKKLQKDPSVKYIEEDQIITLVKPEVKPNKPGKYKTHPPAGGVSDQIIPWGVARVNGATSYSGANKAWIVDSGIDLDHPDLNVDIENSKNFIDNNLTADDDNGHGSHVAGIIAAINNDIGVIGVAPGAQVVALKVADMNGVGTISGTIAALDYIATENVGSPNDVVNISLGFADRFTYDLLDAAVVAIANKGIKISIAAGNNTDDATFYSPARVNHPNVYTISAMDKNDSFSSISNYGVPVDYCEPGINIYSCYLDGGYAYNSGTSMAAPHAAGILLLGEISNGGNVINDPDGSIDIIGVH